MFKRAIGSISTLLIVLVVLTNGAVLAATSSGSGIKLSPLRFDLNLAPGKSQTVQFNVTNITNGTATYQAVLNDFIANNTNGTPQLLVVGSKFDPHSIRQFVSSIPNFTLNAGQTKQINVKISIPAGTAGGGYYGAIRFLPASPNGNQTVNIAGSVAGLILITVPGPGMRQDMSITSFNVSSDGQVARLFYTNKGLEANVTFTNNGNVQLPPFGKIIVQNSSNKTIETLTINNTTPPGNVLPQSSRIFSVPLNNIGSLGKYTVTGNFGYGTSGQLLSATTSFYVVATWIVILVIAILAVIILAIIFMPKLFRAWYRRSIKKVYNNQ